MGQGSLGRTCKRCHETVTLTVECWQCWWTASSMLNV